MRISRTIGDDIPPFVPSLSKHGSPHASARTVESGPSTGSGRTLWYWAWFGALLLPLALAACGEQRTDHATLAKVEADQRKSRSDGSEIVCAQTGSNDFARTCTVDRADSDAGLILTVRHPDGAFHRLLVTRDGRGVIAADGAEKAVVTVIGAGEIEVALGGDRYRLPATVKGGAPKTS